MEQTFSAYHGHKANNEMAFIVGRYFELQLLKKLGYNQIDDLDDFEIQAFKVIANTVNREEEKQLKKKK